MRVVVLPASAEHKSITAVPDDTRAMAASEGTRFLVIGNSLAIHGFDPKTFREGISSDRRGPIHVQVAAFRGSGTAEWYRVFKHFFADTGQLPDVLILPMQTRSAHDIKPTIERLVHFSAVSDVPDVFANELRSFGDRIEFLHSRIFASFASREKIRGGLFQRLIPRYHTIEKAAHRLAAATAKAKSNGKKGEPTYADFIRLLHLARSSGVRVICVLIPTGSAYALDDKTRGIIDSQGAVLLDLRNAKGVTVPHHFADGVHLTEEGARLFTRAMTVSLLRDHPDLFKPGGAGRHPPDRAKDD